MSGLYNKFKYNLMKKLVDLSADVCKVILLNNTHTFAPANNVLTDVNTNELANGNGYTTGGATIASPTVTQDDVNNCATFDGADVSWTASTFSASYAVIYDSSVSNNLVACIDFGGVRTVTSGTFTIQWAATGIIRLS